MNPNEVRWKVIKAMLDEFPSLRERAREYLKNQASGSLANERSETGRCAIFSPDS